MHINKCKQTVMLMTKDRLRKLSEQYYVYSCHVQLLTDVVLYFDFHMASWRM